MLPAPVNKGTNLYINGIPITGSQIFILFKFDGTERNFGIHGTNCEMNGEMMTSGIKFMAACAIS